MDSRVEYTELPAKPVAYIFSEDLVKVSTLLQSTYDVCHRPMPNPLFRIFSTTGRYLHVYPLIETVLSSSIHSFTHMDFWQHALVKRPNDS
jgi:hypothetical protein